MKLTFEQMEKWFAAKIRYYAKKFSRAGLEPEDFVHDLLILSVQAEFEEKPTFCRYVKEVLPVDPSHVNRFLLSRSLDLFDRHCRRHRALKNYQTKLVEVTITLEVDEVDHLLKILKEKLSEKEFSIISLKAFPTPEVCALAEKDRFDALKEREEGVLRMNVSRTRVFDKHVAQALHVSPVTVSRAVQKARIYAEAYKGVAS